MKVESRNFWEAKLKVKIRRLAFATQSPEKGSGSEKKRYLAPTNWLADDNETILFDFGKRLKGWFGEVVKTIKPSMSDKFRFGLFCKSLPNEGMNSLLIADDNNKVAKMSDFNESQTWKTFERKDLYELNHSKIKYPEPEVNHMTSGTTGMSLFQLFYVLKPDIIVEGEIFSYVQIAPDAIKQWLETIGQYKGLGDLHNAPESFGVFEIENFEVLKEGKLRF